MSANDQQDASYTPAQVLVLERLTRIETLIEANNEHQRETREKAQQAYNLADQHEKQLNELKDGNKWAFRTGVVLACGFLINLALNIAQGF